MNNLLLEMIAARASASGNPAVAEMLSRLGVSGTGAKLDIHELLAQQAKSNPMAGLLAQHLSAMESRNSAAGPPVIDVEPGVETDGDQTAQCGGGEMETLQDELRLLRERIDLLASALGACCLCWGQDSACRVCRGRGKPGFSMPDQPLFEEFVLPAVRTMRARRVIVSRPAAAQEAKTNEAVA